MNNNPFFTLVIPTYNRAGFIRKTIDSLLLQDFHNFEIIVVDDGSTDNTEEIISSIQDNRLIYLKKKNGERAAARNFGAQHAKGDYINFFDSDDVAYPHHLSTAHKFIAHSTPAIFHLGYDIKDEQGRLLKRMDEKLNIQKKIIQGNFLSCNGVFIRHDVIVENPFNEDRALSSLEDWELWIRMASRHLFLQSSAITSTVIHHNERSVFATDLEKIKSKADRFIHYVFEDTVNNKVYGTRLKESRASVKTYVALHLAMAKAPRKDVWRYLKSGVFDNPGEIFRKRFLVILKLMMGL